MAMEITRLDNPIDAMLLIHKALRTEAARVEKMARRIKTGNALQSIRLAFNSWATSLLFHADQEDRHMTAIMPNFPPARDNETEHGIIEEKLEDLATLLDRDDTRGLTQRVKEALLALHEQQHAELMERLEDVMAVLNQEIGKTTVIPRTQRHLYGRVVALRIVQDDHLESEEAFVLPEVRRQFGEAEQLQIVRQLLVDVEAEDQSWVFDWVARNVSPAEQQLLAALEKRLAVGFS